MRLAAALLLCATLLLHYAPYSVTGRTLMEGSSSTGQAGDSPQSGKYRFAPRPAPVGETGSKALAAGMEASSTAEEAAIASNQQLYKYKFAPRLAGNATIPSASIEGLSPVSGFVKRDGLRFSLNGNDFMFAGTNSYYLCLRDRVSDDDVRLFFRTMNQNNINVVRFFAFVNGDGSDGMPTPAMIQPTLGSYDEAGLRRLDLILSEASKNGVRLIMPLVNFWRELGGAQWYVDQVHGSNPKQDIELFFSDWPVQQAYRNYIATILNRRNTITGVTYKDDPVILAVELCNEPHTTDNYEGARGMQPGKIVRDWVWATAEYIKSIDSNHMVSTGEEGYRVDGPPGHLQKLWIDSGWKGSDYSGNINSPHIDFATIHVYPENWAIAASEAGDWVTNYFVPNRAQIAHSLGKPFILEEYGETRKYISDRDSFMRTVQTAANDNGSKGSLVWEVWAWPVADDSDVNFDFQQSGAEALKEQINLMHTTATSYNGCSDVAPSGGPGCSDQAKWGKCNEPWMQGFCYRSCGICS